MKKIIYAALFFVGVSFSCLLAEDLSFPLPSDAVKTSEKSSNTGLMRTTTQIYMTALSKDKVISMYKKELGREGWVERSNGVFSKGGYMAIIVAAPLVGKANKTQFSITTTKMPTKEEVLASSKDIPDKLDFMPVYPGSKQNFLWDTPTGVSVSYSTAENINDVVFFYKSAMLSYGWGLSAETPVTTNISDCPECQKAAGKSVGDAIKVTSSKASLIFRKANRESCIIKLYQSIADQGRPTNDKPTPEIEDLDLSSNGTTILVTYNGHKKINP